MEASEPALLTAEQQKELEEEEDEPIVQAPETDYSDWETADPEDLLMLKVPEVPEKVYWPLDPVKRKYILFFIRELTIKEQLGLMEIFFAFDKKGEAKLKWMDYYARAFILMVVKSSPTVRWKQAKYYGPRFLEFLMKYLPNPFDLQAEGPGGITELEEKNSGQPSEIRKGST